MAISESLNQDTGELHISGSFSFSDCNEFRLKLFNVLSKKIKSLRIDVSKLDSIDSAGLGMFLVAGNNCKEASIDLSIFQPQGSVKVLLEVTRSYERFKIIE